MGCLNGEPGLVKHNRKPCQDGQICNDAYLISLSIRIFEVIDFPYDFSLPVSLIQSCSKPSFVSIPFLDSESNFFIWIMHLIDSLIFAYCFIIWCFVAFAHVSICLFYDSTGNRANRLLGNGIVLGVQVVSVVPVFLFDRKKKFWNSNGVDNFHVKFDEFFCLLEGNETLVFFSFLITLRVSFFPIPWEIRRKVLVPRVHSLEEMLNVNGLKRLGHVVCMPTECFPHCMPFYQVVIDWQMSLGG